MLHFTEGFYPTAEQNGLYKQQIDFIESQEWGRVGKGVLLLFFFYPFCCQEEKKKTFTLMSFCSFESKGYPIYNAWALTAKLEASFWQFGNFCLIVKVDLSAWQIIISDHS